ncbi:MAG: hypothetical protein WC728_01660 [Elusimicrobiota bacterium]
MRRDILKHLSLQAVCGAVIGFIAGVTLMSLAIPDPARMIAPPDMLADLDRLALLSVFVRKAHWLWTLLLLGAAASSWLLAAPRISPELGTFPFLQTPKPLKAWAAAAFSGMAALFGIGLILDSFQAGCCALTEGAPAAVYAACGALLWGAAWLILRPKRAARSIAWGTLAGLGAAGVAYGLKDLFWLLFTLNVDLWTLSAEVAAGGVLRNLLLCCLIGAAGLSLALGLAAAVGADDAPPFDRLKRAALPLGLCAALAAGFGLLRLYAGRHDYGKPGLWSAAGLKGKLMKRAYVLLPGEKAAHPWTLDAHYTGFMDSGSVPAQEENLALLSGFLSGRGRASVFRNAALNAIPSICLTLWEPGRMASLYDEVLGGLGPGFGPPMLWTLQRVSWLANRAPVTEENKRMLERFSSYGFHLPENHSRNLAQGRLRLQGPAPGVVRGRLSAPDANGIRVGLFLFQAGSLPPADPALLASRIVDSRAVGKDGTFEFDRLSAGDYFLCLRVPHEKMRAELPGRIHVDLKNPASDVGVIRVRSQ